LTVDSKKSGGSFLPEQTAMD